MEVTSAADNAALVISWIIIFAICLSLAWLWMVILIRVVLNDEEAKERIRRWQRVQEERIRAQEEKARQMQSVASSSSGASERFVGSVQKATESAPPAEPSADAA